jgi:hypothetical protein
MRRILTIAATAAFILGVAAPAVLAADPTPGRDGSALFGLNSDVTVPAGQDADVVFVANADATIAGDVRTVIVIEGTADLQGATVDDVFVARGSVTVDAASTVTGDVRTLGSTVTVDPAATVGGTVASMETDVVTATAILAPAILLFMLGFVVVTLVAGLALAALAARQVRAAETLIGHEPGQTLLVGLAGLIVVPVVAVLAMITVIGAPLGLAILFLVWPAAAYVGYLVAGIWIGEWLLRGRGSDRAERPYMAAVVGLLVLQLISLIPLVGAIASLFGFGAVLLLAWRVFRQPTSAGRVTTPPATQPLGV